MKLLIPLLFLFNLYSQAQDVSILIQRKARVGIHIDESLSKVAKGNAMYLISSYSDGAPEDLQAALDNLDDSWYNDVDVFLGDDIESVMGYISSCDNAYFMEHYGNVLIDVTETYNLCMVTIYTIP